MTVPTAREDVLSLETASESSVFTVSELVDEESIDKRPHAAPVHHSTYYFEDEHIKLQAEDTLFRVHAYLFERESDKGKNLVEYARVAEDRLVVIEDATVKDIERLCEVLYCRSVLCVFFVHSLAHAALARYSPPLTSKDEWISVLHLAHRWDFATMRSLAIDHLTRLATPVDRVVLGHMYDVRHWLLPAYQEICEDEAWLSDEEGRRLGIDDVLKIGRARHALRSNDPSDKTKSALVREIFGHFGADVEAVDLSVVVPGHVLPSASEDVHVSSLSAERCTTLKEAIALVEQAQLEAQHVAAAIEPLKADAQRAVDKIHMCRNNGWTVGHQDQANFDRSQSGLPIFAELEECERAKVGKAQAALLALLLTQSVHEHVNL
jgi:hypothetical protein